VQAEVTPPISVCIVVSIVSRKVFLQIEMNPKHNPFSLIAPVLVAWLKIFAVLCFLVGVVSASDESTPTNNNAQIQELAPLLADKKTRSAALETMLGSDAPRVRVWLNALLEGDLYIRKSDKAAVTVEKRGKQYLLTNASSGDAAGVAGKREVTKIKINNSIRTKLRSAIASMSLQDSDPKVRMAAVERMMQSMKSADLELLQQRIPNEPDKRVASLLDVAVNLHGLSSQDDQERFTAISNIGVNTRDTSRYTATGNRLPLVSVWKT